MDPENPLKYEKAADLKLTMAFSMECPELTSMAKTFSRNLARTAALGQLPALMAGWSGILQYIDDSSRLAAGIDLESKAFIEGSANFNPDIKKAKDKAAVDIFSAARDQGVLDQKGLKTKGIFLIDTLCSSETNHISEGIEALLVGMLLGAWTSFESLATDLWETALNLGPKEWAELVIKTSPTGDLKEEKASKEEKNYKYVRDARLWIRFQGQNGNFVENRKESRI